jgi:DNA-directed RNA polymerase specialized sigma24 family protein
MSDSPLVWPLEAARLYEVLMQRLRRRFPQEDEALLEDAITQALELLVRQPGRYTPQRGSLLSWLWGVARNRLKQTQRKNFSRAQHEVSMGVAAEKFEEFWCPLSHFGGVEANIVWGDEMSSPEQVVARQWWLGLPRRQRRGLRLLGERASRWQGVRFCTYRVCRWRSKSGRSGVRRRISGNCGVVCGRSCGNGSYPQGVLRILSCREAAGSACVDQGVLGPRGGLLRKEAKG